MKNSQNGRTLFQLLVILILVAGTAQGGPFFKDYFTGGNSNSAPQPWTSYLGTQKVESGWLHTYDDLAAFPRGSFVGVGDGNPSWQVRTVEMDAFGYTTLDPFTGFHERNVDIYFLTSGIVADPPVGGIVGNFYRLGFLWTDDPGAHWAHNRVELSSCRNSGGFACQSLFAQTDVAGILNETAEMHLLITVVQGLITVDVDGTTIINGVQDSHASPLIYGGLALGSIWETHARYDNVEISGIPEPSSMTLILSAMLGGLGYRRWRPVGRLRPNLLP